MNAEAFSPKSLLKSRRPEWFSDTVFKEITELDRSLLEFHLSSLTSRSLEFDFERFSRRLCEREICPNLRPQTGPTGGGTVKWHVHNILQKPGVNNRTQATIRARELELLWLCWTR